MMQLAQVKYFVESARVLNFTRAAANCGVSQPALSRGIRALEREFGGALLHRVPNVAITDLGRRVLPFLQQIEQASAQALCQARSLASGDLVPVALGIDGSVSTQTIATMLRDLQAKYEGLSLRLESGTSAMLMPALMDGRLDLIIRATQGGEETAHVHRVLLTREAYVVVHPERHRFAGTTPLALHQLLEAPDRLCFCPTAEALLAQAGRLAPPRHVASGAEHFAQLIDGACGWGLVPAGHSLTTGRATRALAEPAPARLVELVYAAGRPHTPGVAALIRLARAQEARQAA